MRASTLIMIMLFLPACAGMSYISKSNNVTGISRIMVHGEEDAKRKMTQVCKGKYKVIEKGQEMRQGLYNVMTPVPYIDFKCKNKVAKN